MQHIATIKTDGGEVRLYLAGDHALWVGADAETEAKIVALSASTHDDGLSGYVGRVAAGVGGQALWITDNAEFVSGALMLGGPGSGNWGHAGRPGLRGGSLPRGTAMSIGGKDYVADRLLAKVMAARGGGEPSDGDRKAAKGLAAFLKYDDMGHGDAKVYASKLKISVAELRSIMKKTAGEIEAENMIAEGDKKIAELAKADADKQAEAEAAKKAEAEAAKAAELAARKKALAEARAAARAKKKAEAEAQKKAEAEAKAKAQEGVGATGTAVSPKDIARVGTSYSQLFADSTYPLCTAYGKSNEVTPSTLQYSETRAKYKDTICKALAKRAGISEDVASMFIHQWANSSNDNDMRSLSIQEAASLEFGVPLSSWQKKKIEAYRAMRDAFDTFDRGSDSLLTRVDTAIKSGKSNAEIASMLRDYAEKLQVVATKYNKGGTSYQGSALDNMAFDVAEAAKGLSFSGSAGAEIRKNLLLRLKQTRDTVQWRRDTVEDFNFGGATRAQNTAIMRRTLREMYNMTQAHFQKLGVTEVTVARGVKMAGAAAKKTPTGPGKYKANAIESWSSNINTAKNFSGKNGHLMTMRVPVSRILGTAATGFGCLSEYEYVLLGNPNDVAFINNLGGTDWVSL